LLVAHKSDLPGFRFSRSTLESSTSAAGFARTVLGERGRVAREEIALLKRSGLREGVRDFFIGLRGEAVSIAYVLRSGRAARHLLAAYAQEDLAEPGVMRFPTDTIPTSVAWEAIQDGGGYANVMFMSGRCVLLVGDAIHELTPLERPSVAPLAGATALYHRVKRLCA
jgi:hypothetical protein